jgi:hypothetical protein
MKLVTEILIACITKTGGLRGNGKHSMSRRD